LRIASSTYLHVNFLVVADRERFALVGRRSNAFAVIPVETVQSIRVGETESGFWNREVTLAIFLVVEGPKGITELPIVPAGDDFGGRMTCGATRPSEPSPRVSPRHPEFHSRGRRSPAATPFRIGRSMSEREAPSFEPIPPGEERVPAAVRAIWYWTTERSLMRLGMARSTTFEGWPEYVVSADEKRFTFSQKRAQVPFMTIPTGRIRSIWVSTTAVSYPVLRQQLVTTIVLNVEEPGGIVALPVVPRCNNGRRKLIGWARAVHLLAERLSDASGVPTVGRGR